MKITKRRDFLKASLQALVFTNLFINQSSKASFDKQQLSKISPSISSELQEIYLSWKKKYRQEPDEFLSLSGVADLTSVNEKTRFDFLQGNTIEVHGLILGKTEAAFLAALHTNDKA